MATLDRLLKELQALRGAEEGMPYCPSYSQRMQIEESGTEEQKEKLHAQAEAYASWHRAYLAKHSPNWAEEWKRRREELGEKILARESPTSTVTGVSVGLERTPAELVLSSPGRGDRADGWNEEAAQGEIEDLYENHIWSPSPGRGFGGSADDDGGEYSRDPGIVF